MARGKFMSESNSSKFYGLSLVIHTLLVVLVIYLNYPAIKQKFKPDPLSVEIQTAPVSETVAAPAVSPTPAAVPDSTPTKTVEATQIQNTVAQSDVVVKKAKTNKARLKIQEFKDEENLTSTSIRLPSKNQTQQPVAVSTPKEITETPIVDDTIPLPNLVNLDPETGNIEGAEPVQKVAPAPAIVTTPTQRKSTNEIVRNELQNSLPAKTVITETAITESIVSNDSSSSIARPAPEEVREIADLRQRPGNPLPRYSDIERLRRHEGEVTYLAFVTAEGRLTNFILTQSSGFSNLDQKTLNSLKSWRFYPGQEGWVEIPQVWVLTGEAEEAPAQLRR